MRIRLTELGWKGLLLLVALVVAFLATAYHNLFFLLLAFAGATAVFGAYGALAATRGIRMVLATAPIGPAGQALRVRVAIEAAVGHAALAVTVQLECKGRRQDLQALPLLVGGNQLSLSLPGLPRGVHTGRLWLMSRHPFGLVEVARPASAPFELLVHPQPRIGAAALAKGGEESGETSQSAIGPHGPQVVGLRPFVRGDALAMVHWKASARRGSPVVKEREPERAARRDLWLERSGPAEQFEARLAAVTGQLLAAVANQESVRLRSQDYDSGWLAPRTAPRALLRHLAEVQHLQAEDANA